MTEMSERAREVTRQRASEWVKDEKEGKDEQKDGSRRNVSRRTKELRETDRANRENVLLSFPNTCHLAPSFRRCYYSLNPYLSAPYAYYTIIRVPLSLRGRASSQSARVPPATASPLLLDLRLVFFRHIPFLLRLLPLRFPFPPFSCLRSVSFVFATIAITYGDTAAALYIYSKIETE